MNKIHINLIIGCLLLVASVHANSLLKPISQHTFMNNTLITWNELYTDIVDCGSVSQTDLFRRARLWLVQAAGSEQLTLSDSQTGDLAGRMKHVVTVPRSESSAGGVYRFQSTIVIECAARKYRARIGRLELETNGSTQPIALDTFCQMNPEACDQLTKQLKEALASLQQDVKGYKSF